MVKREREFIQIVRVLQELEPENQKKLYEMIQDDKEDLKENFLDLVYDALDKMVKDNPTQRLVYVFDKIKTMKVLNDAKKQEELKNDDLEKLLAESNEIIDSVMGGRKAG